MSKTCLMCGETYPDSATFCPRDGSTLRATVIGDDLIGELFCERYVVTDMLGEGGMASVYLARDVRLPQQVAIKVLRDAGGNDATLVQRFRQEAEAASRINHDRVARVSDFGFMTDGRAFLVMEYVNGRTLRAVLDERGSLSFAEAANITSMVAEGLNAAHKFGIVHRDLKPENVMVVEDDDGSVRVKVLDFGIAKLLESKEAEGRTAPGFVIGTPKWMSPEQLLGMPLDGRSDIYALALLAFAMLTGDRAFGGDSEQAEMLARLSTPPRTLKAVRPDIAWPEELQALFTRTLVRDPESRPATAVAFAREFARIVDAPGASTSLTSMPRTPAATPVPAANAPAANVPPSLSPLAPSASGSPIAATPARAATPAIANSATNGATAASTKSARGIPRAALFGGIATVAVVAAVMVWKRQSSESTPSGVVAADTSKAPPVVQAPATPSTRDSLSSAGAAVDDSLGSQRQDSILRRKALDSLAAVAAARDSLMESRESGKSGPKTESPKPVAQKPPAAPPVTRTPANTSGKSPAGTATRPAPAAEGDPSDALEKLINEADQSIGTYDEAAKRSKATELIRQFEALVPRLTSNDDRGWAAFYIGTSRATLGDNAKACASLLRAQALATNSKALKSSAEKFLLELNCAGR